MKFSLNLVKQFVDIKYKPEKLADLLSEKAFEVEGFEVIAVKFSGVVTAKVIKIDKHPNADRLRVVTLSIGKKTIEPVVCGAHNFVEGDIVALALPGAFVPKNAHDPKAPGSTLEKATIRGVESQGMICAKFELGLEDEVGEGIMILPKDTKLGVDLSKIIGEDIIFDVSLPANRPDLFSHYGIAREVSAVTGGKLKEVKLPKLSNFGKEKVAITIASKNDCQKYIAAKLTNIQVSPSPLWMQEILKNCGIRPINNLVDITNYVSIELGQPMHAFDAKNINGKITVRLSKSGESIETLDHKTRNLSEGLLLISDQKKPLAVAGVMGGVGSEISEQTTEVILESANFNPVSVRKAAKFLNLRTDSSSKFEKGLHQLQAELGMARAIELFKEFAGGRLVSINQVSLSKYKDTKINFTSEQISKLIGHTYKDSEIKQALSRYQIKISGTRLLTAVIPYFRQDITAVEDLAEEVIKVMGINSIPKKPLVVTAVPGDVSSQSLKIRKLKSQTARLGYSEVQNYSFISEVDIIKFGDDPKSYLQIANPLSGDQGYLKKHLDIPMLKCIARNLKTFPEVSLFEVGKEYFAYENEPLILLLAQASKTTSAEILLANLKSDLVEFCKLHGIKSVVYKKVDSQTLSLFSGTKQLGTVSVVSQTHLKNFEINSPVIFARIELETLFALSSEPIFESYSKFPSVSRDISVILASETNWSELEEIIQGSSAHITNIELVGSSFLDTDKHSQEFHAKLAQNNQKNLAIRIALNSPEKTLNEAEITGVIDQIVLQLKNKLKAEIR
jgi:phenylalanyl-tRNA synthetase beta chain